MNPERWKQIKQVCHSALELEPDQREVYLKEACAGDEPLLKEESDSGQLQNAVTVPLRPGLRIAFDSQGPSSLNIFVVDAQGGAYRPLNEGDRMDVRPSWSRDGRWIYFGSNRSGTNQIWKSSVTGENVR